MSAQTVLQVVALPYKIRALAKVIHDVDHIFFYELYDQRGKVKKEELRKIAQELGTQLDDISLMQFNMAFEEYGQQLRGVDFTGLAKNSLTEALTFTTSIDGECSLNGISLATSLGAVHATHTFLIKIVLLQVPGSLQPVFNIFMTKINKVLSEILILMKSRALCRRSDPLSEKVLLGMTKYNTTLWFFISHLQWFVEAAKHSIFFNAADVIEDISALEVWKQYVGIHVPACSAEHFAPALRVFPEWAQAAIRKILDYLECGVVSVYSLQRLLKIWGPFLLLDRNLRRDLTLGMLCLEETTEVKGLDLRNQKPGSYVVTLSREEGHLDVQVVTPKGILKKVTVNRLQGAWVLSGISYEEFETLYDACVALPTIFVHPIGDKFDVPPITQEEANDSYSVLHRVCFRNNTGYVKKLLQRGGNVLVNSAVADPSITTKLTWTPLLCAVNNANSDPVEIVEALVENGCDVRYVDEAGCTALYYSIVNGYGKTVQFLLQCEPLLCSSHSTVPLLLALGAHHYNVSDVDNHRAADVVPSPKVVQVLSRVTRDALLIRTAIQIVEAKLNNMVHKPRGPFRVANPIRNTASRLRFPSLSWAVSRAAFAEDVWNFGDFEVPKLNDSQLAAQEEAIMYHGLICRKNSTTVKEVLHVLRMHSFFLSCQELVMTLRNQTEEEPESFVTEQSA